jgi:hypothetical protein
MINLKLIELYNTSSRKMLLSLLDKSFIDFLLKNENDLLDMKLLNKVKRNNDIYSDIKTTHKFSFPDFIENIVGNQSYDVTTREIFDLKNIKTKGIVKSKIFDRLSITLTFNIDYNDLGIDFCQKNIIFNIKCEFPVVGKKIEKIMEKNFKMSANKRYKIITKWIDNYKNKELLDNN